MAFDLILHPWSFGGPQIRHTPKVFFFLVGSRFSKECGRELRETAAEPATVTKHGVFPNRLADYEVVGGLSERDRLLVTPPDTLQEGAVVRIPASPTGAAEVSGQDRAGRRSDDLPHEGESISVIAGPRFQPATYRDSASGFCKRLTSPSRQSLVAA